MRKHPERQLTKEDYEKYRTRFQVLLFSIKQLKKNALDLICYDSTNRPIETDEQYIDTISATIASTLYQYREKIALDDTQKIDSTHGNYTSALRNMQKELHNLASGEIVSGEKLSDTLRHHKEHCETKIEEHPWSTVSKVLFQGGGNQQYVISTDIDTISEHIESCKSMIKMLVEFPSGSNFSEILDTEYHADTTASHIANFFYSSHRQRPKDNKTYETKGYGEVSESTTKKFSTEEFKLLYSGIKKTLIYHLMYRDLDHRICQPIRESLTIILIQLDKHQKRLIMEKWEKVTDSLKYSDKLSEQRSEKIKALKNRIRKKNPMANLTSSRETLIEAIHTGLIVSTEPGFNSKNFIDLSDQMHQIYRSATEKDFGMEVNILLRSLNSIGPEQLATVSETIPPASLPDEDMSTKTLPKKKKKNKNKKELKNASNPVYETIISCNDTDIKSIQDNDNDIQNQAANLIQRTFVEYRSKKDLGSLQNTLNKIVSYLFYESSITSTTSAQIQTFFNHLLQSLKIYTLKNISQSDSISMIYESLVTASTKYPQDALNPKTTIAWIPVDKLTQLIDREYKRTTESHPYQELIRSESSTHPELIWFSKLTENTQAICRHMADVLDILPKDSEKFFFGSRLCEGLPIDEHMIDKNTDMDFFCLIPDTANIKHATTLLLNSLHSPTTSPFTLQIDNDETHTLEPFSIKVINTTRNICNIKLLCSHHSITTPIDLTIISMTHDMPCDYEGTLLDQYRKLPIITTDGTGISLSVINTHMRPLNTITISSDLQSHYAHELKHPTFHKFQQYTKNNLRCVMKKVLRAFYLSAVHDTDLPDDIQVMSWSNTVKYPQDYTIQKHSYNELYTLCNHKIAWLTELKKRFPLKDVFNKLFDLCIGSIVPLNEQLHEFFDHICRTANATREINSNFIALFNILFDELNPSDQEKKKDWLYDIRKGEWLDPRSPHMHSQTRQRISGDLTVTVYMPHTFNNTRHCYQNDPSIPLDPDVYPSRGPSP
ncbi:MAG: hypothetical protein CMF55_06105 [Legionellales bacterium]|nr:hypothetical protein [Legionellales bacterium]